MKYNVYLIVLIVINLIVAEMVLYLGFPVWMIFLCFPLLVYLQIYAGNKYSFRENLKLTEIPETGNGKRLADLRTNENIVFNLGFKKIDQFYLKTTIDVLTFSYFHHSEPIILNDYNLAKIRSCDLITRFDNGFTLTTSNSVTAGKFPRKNERILQLFPEKDFDELLHHHLQALNFLKSNEFEAQTPSPQTFREDFMRSFMESRKLTTSLLSPLKIFYWIKISDKKTYEKPVHQQVFARTLFLDQPAHQKMLHP